MPELCQFCKKEIQPGALFCSFCGKKVEREDQLDLATRIRIYSLSFFLAPFGLYWFFKYIRSPKESYKKLAIHVLLITLFALGASGLVLNSYINAMRNYTDIYRANLDVYSQLGY